MKKLLIMLVAILTMWGCGKVEESWDCIYPKEQIINHTFTATQVCVSDDWWLDEEILPEKYRMSIRFNEDGTYESTGFVYEGQGNYSIHGNTITTYVGRIAYFYYVIDYLDDKYAEMTLTSFNNEVSIRVRFEK